MQHDITFPHFITISLFSVSHTLLDTNAGKRRQSEKEYARHAQVIGKAFLQREQTERTPKYILSFA